MSIDYFKDYICHSGGCTGADMYWEKCCDKYSIKTISYSFPDHKCDGRLPRILNNQELNEGWKHVKIAAITLNKTIDFLPSYMKGLLARNWFQVKNSEAIFAVSTFLNTKVVNGGTGWAVQMAVDNKKPIYVFEQNKEHWYNYSYDNDIFELCDIPKLTKNFAGIGARDLKKVGMIAMKNIFKNECNIKEK